LDKESIYGRTILKGNRKEIGGHGLDAASLTSECGNWPLGLMKHWQFLDQLSNY